VTQHTEGTTCTGHKVYTHLPREVGDQDDHEHHAYDVKQRDPCTKFVSRVCVCVYVCVCVCVHVCVHVCVCEGWGEKGRLFMLK